MTKDQHDVEIARHFMRALDARLVRKGISRKEAEVLAGLSPSTLTHWMNGAREPNVRRFSQVVHALGLDPGEVLNDGWTLAVEAGLLDDDGPQ